MLLTYICKDSDENLCVGYIIKREFDLSSRLLSNLKNCSGIKVDDKVVTVRYKVKRGQALYLEVPEKASESIEPCDISLDILYEDNDILLVNKPKAMPTHPSAKHHNDTLANAVMFRYKNENFTFRAITRLDEDTSGVVLIARNPISAQRLSKSMAQKDISKTYIAICDGVPPMMSGTINAPIGRCSDSIIKRCITPLGKEAITDYEVLEILKDGKHSLIKLNPVTGRTHQLRLHLSHIGCAIHGDFLYGVQENLSQRALLHCQSLTFPHPTTKEILTISCPMPKDFEEFLSK